MAHQRFAAQPPPRFSAVGSSPSTDLVALDGPEATTTGLLLAASRTNDIVDARVVICARRTGQAVVTSDADDLRRIDPGLQLVVV